MSVMKRSPSSEAGLIENSTISTSGKSRLLFANLVWRNATVSTPPGIVQGPAGSCWGVTVALLHSRHSEANGVLRAYMFTLVHGYDMHIPHHPLWEKV